MFDKMSKFYRDFNFLIPHLFATFKVFGWLRPLDFKPFLPQKNITIVGLS